LKPRDAWRDGMTLERLKAELDKLVTFPGLSNAWVMPIRTRIDMLATGIKTPVGIKVAGPDLAVIEVIGRRLEKILADVPGTVSVYSERVDGGRYIRIALDRERAARYGLNVSDVQTVIRTAVGGTNITETVEGRERYPVNLRYPPEYRDSVEKLKLLPLVTPGGGRLALADVAKIEVESGPPMIKSENARPNGWTFVDIADRDLGSYVADAQRAVADELELPAGYALQWSGQFEYLVRAKERLKLVVPATLFIIVLLIYLHFRDFARVAIIIGSLPFALIGSGWLLYLLEFDLSVAVGVGVIALAGLAAEIGVLMVTYLDQARRDAALGELRSQVLDGAVRRLRPIVMTSGTVIVGLAPIMLGTGTGSEVMQRIAAPMAGGMLTTLIFGLIVLPVVYYVVFRSHPSMGKSR
jgi:Cu(I)/Ag(I) efflux system membrane protein CusA/SilA